ncbi:MAG: Gfo/Idh/MocA family protein [Romboutsia sp.]|uniref:Gfo/Idh/MocA family protein n=1 Tax=Romboutsia sp. TaxID=1965302 RepID=UPI003F3E69BD
MRKINIAIIGGGVRGTYIYAQHIYKEYEDVNIIAIVEPRKGRRDFFKETFDIIDENTFESVEAMLEHSLDIDGVIITSGDDSHFYNAKIFLEKGYNVLLENPLANTLDRIIRLKNLNNKDSNKLLMSCNTLKNHELFQTIKKVIHNNELGELISVEYNSNIGYSNFVHSYVRGNWRNHSDTSPLILNNSSQDISMLVELVGSKCRKISSFGSLKHINKSNFKFNIGENCFVCSIEEKCPYSAKKIYLEEEIPLKNAVHINPTKPNLEKILSDGPYGRCIYMCDNNVVDNMINILEFENGVTANLNIHAFTKEFDKKIRLLFSHGEVEGSILNRNIKIKKFKHKEDEIIELKNQLKYYTEDFEFINVFINKLRGKNESKLKIDINEELESHIVAFAAEYARVSEEVVYISEFLEDSIKMTIDLEMKLS